MEHTAARETEQTPAEPSESGSSGKPTVLAVDDDEQLLTVLKAGMGKLGFDILTERTIEGTVAAMKEHDVDLVLTDLDMGDETGIELAERLRGIRPDVPVLMMTGVGSMDSAVDALRVGIQDFIQKPIDLPALQIRLRRALDHRALFDEVRRLREQGPSKPERSSIIGESPAIERVRELITRVATTDATVLITGESGTGKELIAREIHQESHRGSGPFVTVNCAALPSSLIESELFGHEKGAFTDARQAREGLFMQAHGGTLFLDEIGELGLDVQAKLLRSLEERKVRPVGGAKELPFDARLITATHRDLEEWIEAGAFREDLYYRLCVVDVASPPLRSRGQDILTLAHYFLEQQAREMGRPLRGFVPEAARKLLDYDWPGNVRELQNCVRRAVALARHDQITVEDLPDKIQAFEPERVDLPASTDASQLLPLSEIEKRYIRRVLKAVGGNKSQAARILGFDRRTLYRKLEQMEKDGSSEEG